MHLPQITALQRELAEPTGERELQRMANWAGEFISSALRRRSQGHGGRGPALSPASGRKAGRRALPSTQRSAACLQACGIFQSHLRTEPLVGPPTRPGTAHFSASFQTEWGFRPEKGEKDSIRTRSRCIYVRKIVHGQRVTLLILKGLPEMASPSQSHVTGA